MYEDTINMEFPQFRKLKNGRSYYRIDAANEFTELQQVGSKWLKYEFKVAQYPDKMLLQDMLQQQDPYLVVSAGEYQSILEKI